MPGSKSSEMTKRSDDTTRRLKSSRPNKFRLRASASQSRSPIESNKSNLGKQESKTNSAENEEGDGEAEGEAEEEFDDRGLSSKAYDDADGIENVRVMVRCRPSLDHPEEDKICVQVNGPDRCIDIGERKFYFDQVFGPETNNELVYMRSARSLVEAAFKGYNCTIFLYGQTGTGKTYTHSSLSLNSFAHIFRLIQDSNMQASFLIRASYYELYNEDIRDLLKSSDSPNKPLELRESKERGVYIKDLSSYLVNNLAELEKLKRLGDRQRATASTMMNEHSSRSHSIFTITIEAVDDPVSSKEKDNPTTKIKRNSVRMGRLNLIDLAGSERQSKSGSSGTRLKEASRINLSLTCLSLVIRALTDPNSTHIPYRNSKLTRLLSNSLGGNSKTLLIACISPDNSSFDETLNTLRFSQRTKKIKNDVKINEDPKDALLRKYRQQIDELREKLKARQVNAGKIGGSSGGFVDDETAIESLVKGLGDNLNGGKVRNSDSDEGLVQQLRLLKSKIVVGGVNLLEKAEIHERLLEASRKELEEKILEEVRLKDQLDKKQVLIDHMAQSKESLENQVGQLDEKLQRVLVLYSKTKEERRDLDSEHDELKESLLQSIRAISKEIKFADCIINDFIPGQFRLVPQWNIIS